MKRTTLSVIVVLVLVVSLFALTALPAQAWQTALDTAYDCSTQADIPQTECSALAALYNSTNGSGWADSTGWLTTNHPCLWYGVECLTGHVIRLRLPNNKLSGIIPVEIGNLVKMQTLDLGVNHLSESIPVQLGNLT